MARGSIPPRPTPDLTHPDVLRAVLAGVLATGDVVGRDHAGRLVLTLAVEDWLFDKLAALDAALEDLEPEPTEDDDPAEDEEGAPLYLGTAVARPGRRRRCRRLERGEEGGWP